MKFFVMKATPCLVFFLFTVVVFLCGCSGDFEQSYHSYDDLERLHNLRLQGWFPDMLGPDGFDLREVHSIGPIESFGKFSYSDHKRIDSLLSDKGIYREVSIDSLNQFMKGFKTVQAPDWFLKKEEYSGKAMFRREAMYFIQSKEDSTIYFACKS